MTADADESTPERSAIVTGAAQGIGRAVAHRLAEDGVAVAVVDIQDDKGAAVAREITDAGGAAVFIHADVAEPVHNDRMVAETVKAFGRLDYLVNNAYRSIPGSAEEVDAADWDRGFAIMVRTMGLAARAAMPSLRSSGAGSIVNISSVHGLLAVEGSVIYETCKAAVIGITRAMALDFGPDGVRVNAICPGAIVTEVNDSEFFGSRATARMGETLYPLRRVGRPSDIADAVTFLVSSRAAFITGHALVVDGGLSVQLQDGLAQRVIDHMHTRDDGRPFGTPPLQP